MGIGNFINHPVRSISASLLEGIINNIDSSLSQKAISLFNISEDDLLMIRKVKRMVNHIAINVDHKNSSLEVKLMLAGEQDELTLSADYTKIQNDEKTIFAFQNLKTSKEWLTILVNDILIGEVIKEDDLQFSTDKLLGKVLNKIL
jgi:hypothetical protein